MVGMTAKAGKASEALGLSGSMVNFLNFLTFSTVSLNLIYHNLLIIHVFLSYCLYVKELLERNFQQKLYLT